ncbi:MAG TPA: SDR family oxidoreductase [Acidimicrobiales bacterium]|nr:SDR family oxidoreductase [Acidimicrobiales bacterium]
MSAGPLESGRAVVTGGSRGIGRAIAERLAAAGATVVVGGRDAEGLAQTVKSIESAGGTAYAVALDVTDSNSVASFAASSVDLLDGAPTVVVNNAGVYKAGRFEDISVEDWAWVMDVNVYGIVRVTQAFLGGMVEAGKGNIVNISSTAGKWASMFQSPYNASKHAVLGLTRCLALETAKAGLVVTAVCPGFVDTPLLLESELAECYGLDQKGLRDMAESRAPIGRLTTPEEVAELVLHLSGPMAQSSTGQSYSIPGGLIFI